jgi:hypothetical protein
VVQPVGIRTRRERAVVYPQTGSRIVSSTNQVFRHLAILTLRPGRAAQNDTHDTDSACPKYNHHRCRL